MKALRLILLVAGLTTVILADERPNILFAISDDQSWPHASAYGTEWVKTPGFDRIAKEGLLFHHAFTPNAKCAPSRACILTGRNSWQLKEAANHMPFFPAEFTTYAEALERKANYFVGSTGKTWAPGVAENIDGSPRNMAGIPYNSKRARPPAKGLSGNDYAANFDDFLADAAKLNKPWAFWFGATEPHRPYAYGAGVKTGGKQLTDIDKVPKYWPDNNTVRTDMLDYAFEIEWFDRHLLRMIESLDEKGLLDNTLIIVTSDNGMPFPRVKGYEYLQSNRLPLAIMWKRGIQNPGRNIQDFVSFIDFAPTFLDVANLVPENSTMAHMTGKSLLPIFQSKADGQVIAARDHVLIGKERHDAGRPHDWGYPIRGIVTKDWLYLHNYKPGRWPACDPVTGYLGVAGSPTKTWILNARRNGTNIQYWNLNFGKLPEEELYQIQNDPDCITNLAGAEAEKEVKQQLADRMEKQLRQEEDPRMEGNGEIFDNYPIATDSAKFYERYMKGEPTRSGWVNPTDFEKESLEDK